MATSDLTTLKRATMKVSNMYKIILLFLLEATCCYLSYFRYCILIYLEATLHSVAVISTRTRNGNS